LRWWCGGKSGKYRPFAIRVSRHKMWHFCVIGIERNVCRCSLNRYNLTQFANLSAGEQLCRRCTNRILEHFKTSNSLTPNDHYSDHTAPLTSKRCILYIYSTNICTEYFKHGIYSPSFSLKNALSFIILTYLVPILLKFYTFIQQI